jgi:heme o synthase
LMLFLIIFLWTPPHFWALALYKNEDYRRANIPMMPVVAGALATKKQMIIYSYLLVASTLLLPFLELGGVIFFIGAALLGVVFLHHVHRTYLDTGDKWAKKTFGFSILYLFMLFTLLVASVWWQTR